MINNFSIFIEESYLESNIAPIYHLTTYWSLESILEDNVLKTGWIDNPIFNKKMKIISFTRESKLNISHYKNDLDIVICIDKNKLISDGYKILPYDFFINNKDELYPKSDIRRSKPFEFEEVSLKDIINFDKYIISVDFLKKSLYRSYKSVNILKSKNIKIYEEGRRLF
jgi:hypothetical protein